MGENRGYLVLANLLPLECILSLMFEMALLVMEDIRISWYRNDPQFYPYRFDANLYAGLTVAEYVLAGLKCINIWLIFWGRRNNLGIHLWVRLIMLKLAVIVVSTRTMLFCRQRFGDDLSFMTVTALYYSFNTIIGSNITLQAIEILIAEKLRQNPHQVFYRRWTYCRLPLRKLSFAVMTTLMAAWVYNCVKFAVYGVEQLSKVTGMGNSSVALLSSMVVLGVSLVAGILNVAAIMLRNDRVLLLIYYTMLPFCVLTIVLMIFTQKIVKMDLTSHLVIGFVTARMNMNLILALGDIQFACTLRWITYMTLQKTLPIGDSSRNHNSCFQGKDDIPKKRKQILEGLYVNLPRRLSTGDVLGEGHFSKVYKAELGGFCSGKIKVLAAKEVQMDDLDDTDYASALVSEIKTLQALGKHENLVEFAGLYHRKQSCGLGILLEFCENGSLLDHLRNIREEEGSESNVFRKCLQWSKGIATGMEYLHSRKVVHGDIAARNILLDNNMVAKISDFGMSFKLYTYATYKRTEQKPLPFRWMSPEVLLDFKFSPASDIWAYGVTLWEIFSLGDEPWEMCCFDGKFVRNITIEGKRLEQPTLCPDTLYASVLLKCWELESQDRSDASCIVTELEGYINDGCGEGRVVVNFSC